MDEYKITNFKKHYPSRAFPDFTSLSAEECAALRRKLAVRLGMPTSSSGLDLVVALSERRAVPLGLVDGENAGLPPTFEQELGTVTGPMFINWYRWDRVDRMEFAVLRDAFEDVWYPAVDDIEIVDETLGWVLVVAHDGMVSLVRF